MHLARLAVPNVSIALQKEGKLSSPHPNVDSVSGLLLEALLSDHDNIANGTHSTNGANGNNGTHSTNGANGTHSTNRTNHRSHNNKICNTSNESHHHHDHHNNHGKNDTGLEKRAETVGILLFAISRSIGSLAQLVLDRAVHSPLERPGSLDLASLLGLGLGLGKSKL